MIVNPLTDYLLIFGNRNKPLKHRHELYTYYYQDRDEAEYRCHGCEQIVKITPISNITDSDEK